MARPPVYRVLVPIRGIHEAIASRLCCKMMPWCLGRGHNSANASCGQVTFSESSGIQGCGGDDIVVQQLYYCAQFHPLLAQWHS